MTPTPIFLAPQQGLTPHAYTIHRHSQLCRCGALHEWSEVYSKTHLRSQLGHRYVTNLRPVRTPDEIMYNLPIEVIVREPTKVLFCHECFATASLSHLPKPPVPEPQRPKAVAPAPPRKTAKRGPFTIDDL